MNVPYYYDTQLSIVYASYLTMTISVIMSLCFIAFYLKKGRSFPCKCRKCTKQALPNWKKPMTLKRFVFLIFFAFMLYVTFVFNKWRIVYSTPSGFPYNPFTVLNLTTSSNLLSVEQRYYENTIKYMLGKMTPTHHRNYMQQTAAFALIKNEESFTQWKKQFEQPSQNVIALPFFLSPYSNPMYFIFMAYNTIIFLVFPLLVVVLYFFLKKYQLITRERPYKQHNVKEVLDMSLTNYVSLQDLLNYLCHSNVITRGIDIESEDELALSILLAQLPQDSFYRIPQDLEKRSFKAYVMILCYLTRTKMPRYMEENLARVIPLFQSEALEIVDYFYERQNLDAVVLAVRVGQMIYQACTPHTDFFQLPDFETNQIPLMKKITTVSLSTLQPFERQQKLQEICSSSTQLALWKNYLMFFPGNLEVDMSNVDIYRLVPTDTLNYVVDVEIIIRRPPIFFEYTQFFDKETNKLVGTQEIPVEYSDVPVHTPYTGKNTLERFFLFVEIEGTTVAFHKKVLNIPFSASPIKVVFSTHIHSGVSTIKFWAYLVSECYIGCEYCLKKTVKLVEA
ncbi:hypothetical protein EIN_098620 [Entamoeba invadens IP1]|uniref:SEC63 domain-containing protein n=1 Tax=Entamoeba invadens IP1 TaxID=370355 RepID=A0A0A1U0V2_ENTIV|nr:hypothetical protein EIN_098620 [Entamoeba invadens IP1]ELP87535.1 hypothetical protein EIN_098620 [Entamoeba invadens IP1]|eukprot:XP_004254306.1 hypothetical protein EIN_098620 [Entamoeba invadens IP1]